MRGVVQCLSNSSVQEDVQGRKQLECENLEQEVREKDRTNNEGSCQSCKRKE